MSDFRENAVGAEEQRFVVLETKLAYQEKTISDLNDVLVTQSRTLEAVERRLRALEEQLNHALAQADAPRERPPHY